MAVLVEAFFPFLVFCTKPRINIQFGDSEVVERGIEKSFIKQKTRYKRAESILAMLVCIALEIDYGVSFVLNQCRI